MIVVNMSACANANDCLANTVVEKAIVHENLGKKHGQYFIFMVASVAAILFHAPRGLELLKMMLPRTRVGNFGIKIFSLPTASTKLF